MAVTRTVVGRYEIREEIGRGGTATVFLACQTDLRRLVALKELSAFSAADPGFARRFVRESQLTASLSHPSIVTVHDYFEADGAPFIAMEYLPNGSLRSRAGALSLGRIAGVLESMLGGLAHAHAREIVHRDLKPENVLVTADGGVKIADFGIAKALDSVDTRLTVTGTTIGTPTYMAPEQALAGEIGPWTDLYSVGIVAFELIAGATPFGDAEPVAILLRHVKDKPPPLTLAAAGTPQPLSDWVARLLEKAPGGPAGLGDRGVGVARGDRARDARAALAARRAATGRGVRSAGRRAHTADAADAHGRRRRGGRGSATAGHGDAAPPRRAARRRRRAGGRSDARAHLAGGSRSP